MSAWPKKKWTLTSSACPASAKPPKPSGWRWSSRAPTGGTVAASGGIIPCLKALPKPILEAAKYALRVKDANHARTYEVGVVPRKDGKPGYTLLWDFYMGGYGLQDAVGEGGTKLAHAYAEAVIMQECKKKGLKVKRQVTEDGRILLEATGGRERRKSCSKSTKAKWPLP